MAARGLRKVASVCVRLVVFNFHLPGETDAVDQFIKKHEVDVRGALSGWDRVRFRGTLRLLSSVPGLVAWLLRQGVLFKDFGRFSEGWTRQLKASVEGVAAAAGRKIEYLASSSISKEALVRELLRREGCEEGIVCILSCIEPCRSFDIYRDREKKQLDVVKRLRKCLHWYVYFRDPQWGLCHVRIQSWLPFAVHVCMNGREWLCRQLTQQGIGFVRSDNTLLQVENLSAAQQLLDAQPWADWSTHLQSLLDQACPVLRELSYEGTPLSRYWSADQTEWATDVMFRSPMALDRLYPALLRHAMSTFGSPDVMRFLGRRQLPQAGGVYARFNGEVVSDLKRRPEGVRIKHRMNSNSIKMYDKAGSVLRIETTISDARDLRVYRTSEADPEGAKRLMRLRKGVVDLPRRAQISQAANTRYLEALAAVDSGIPLHSALEKLSQPVVCNGHRSRGLHPLVGRDAQLVDLLLRGEFSINGFRNRDLRQLLFGTTADRAQQRRESGQVSRLLRLLRDHRLIYRVKGTHRYQLTAQGRRLLPTIQAARNANTKKLQELAV